MIPNQYFKIKLEILNFLFFKKSTLAAANSFVFFAELSQEDKEGLLGGWWKIGEESKVKSFLLVIFLNPLIKKRLGFF